MINPITCRDARRAARADERAGFEVVTTCLDFVVAGVIVRGAVLAETYFNGGLRSSKAAQAQFEEVVSFVQAVERARELGPIARTDRGGSDETER